MQQDEKQAQILRLLGAASMHVTLELGRTTRTVQEVLGDSEGSIIDIGRPCGELLDIRVNGKLFAHGEIVNTGEGLTVQICEFL